MKEPPLKKAAKAVLKTTTVDVATCESCHSQDEVEAVTAGVTVLTDMNGTIVNPHALPESADHAEVSCVSCHQMHAAGPSRRRLSVHAPVAITPTCTNATPAIG